ncbi:hypothetical protein B0J17DRAFT_707861 [Rhizoctonia solani]|nr:hypothetical protein B0J17DRAFT_707861 [Rhizoctonia solani]
MNQIFNVPELIRLIFMQLRQPDLARLLATSHLFFNCAMPIVWRRLPGPAPRILLKLLPDGDKYLETLFDAALLKPLNIRSLARFNLYSPHVKILSQRGASTLRNVMWDRLFKLVDAFPILPNLEVLNTPVEVLGQYSVRTHVSHFSAFLSLTLAEVKILRGRYIALPSTLQSVCDFVSNLAQQCPRIRSLKLFYPDIRNAQDYILGCELANSLGQLRHLRFLNLYRMALEPEVLTALSSLPNLESLTLEGAFGSTSKPLEISLPDSGFPALQCLIIRPTCLLGPMTRAWSIPTLVQRLTYVAVCIMGEYNRVDVCDFARAICRYSPLVTSLLLTCDSGKSESCFSPELIDILAQLSLQHLHLVTNNDHNENVRWDSERFALSFPKMNYLRISGFCFTFEDITFVAAHMPLLRKLLIGVKMEADWPSRANLSLLALAPSPSQLHIDLQNIDTNSWPIHNGLPTEKAEVIAACLHALWPKGVICEDNQRNGADEINAALGRLCGTL